MSQSLRIVRIFIDPGLMQMSKSVCARILKITQKWLQLDM